jgi:hypothetical protein
MTPEELQAHKEKMKKIMVDHLTEKHGYPNCTLEQIGQELKEMWVKLEDANLILEGMTFQAFFMHADQAFTFAKMQEIMGI